MMMKMEADIVVMTTPDLDNLFLKRSLVKKDIEYIYVPHDMMSAHMGFREGAFNNFDTFFAAGPHLYTELRAMEKMYNTKELAQYLRVGISTIEKMRQDGELAYARLGRTYVYTQEDVDNLIKNNHIEFVS
jgi:YidC/Oxa1 family membrane protein insertase